MSENEDVESVPANERSKHATKPPITVEPIKQNDMQPSYAHVSEPPSDGSYGDILNAIGSCVGLFGMLPCCICFPSPVKFVTQGSVGLVTRFGQFYKAVDPGLVQVNVLTERLHLCEVQIQVLEIPQQVCLTKDNVNVDLSSVIYFHIVAPYKAVFGVSNVTLALQERCQTTLRLVVGARTLQEIIEKREEVAKAIQEIIDESAPSWGVKVESILIKDVHLSPDLQDALAQAAKSKRAGESKVITARAEVESAKLMRKAADILSSPAAMQIRYLEAMQQMAKTSQSKVIFMPSLGSSERLSGVLTKDIQPQERVDDSTALYVQAAFDGIS